MSIWKEEVDEKSLELKRAKHRVYQKRYYQKHRDEIIAKKIEQDRYKDRSEWTREYYRTHREEKLRKKKEWYYKNREEILKKERERYWKKKKMKEYYKEKENGHPT